MVPVRGVPVETALAESGRHLRPLRVNIVSHFRRHDEAAENARHD
jgi:hypothetical protein